MNCSNCGNEIEKYASRLHEELGVCGDDCGIGLVDETQRDYARACSRLAEVRNTLKRALAIDPDQYEGSYPSAFGAIEAQVRIARIEAGAN